jgi:hypothetical protein
MNTEGITPFERAQHGEERLWRIWWQWGIPLAMFASGLTVLAGMLHEADYRASGDALDVVKFLIYIAWFRMAWRCSKNTDQPLWTNLTRLAVCLGFGVIAFTL